MLGRLFRFDAVRDVRTELLIIMTPYIMKTEEQNEWLNARESERMSWCIADIVNIHGPVGLSGNPAFNMHSSDVIFPDLDPAAPGQTPATEPGTMPHGTMPPGLEPGTPTGPTPATPPPPLPGLPGAPLPIDPLVPPPPGSYGLQLPPPPAVHRAPVGTGTMPPAGSAGPSAVGSARRGVPAAPSNELRTPHIEPVAPPPGTQSQYAPLGSVAPAVYER